LTCLWCLQGQVKVTSIFFKWNYPTFDSRIVVRPESSVMFIDEIIQFKSCFIRENYIKKKDEVIVSFCHHKFAKFHTAIKIFFVQLLYQINFIWIKLDFFQNSLHNHATNVMLLIVRHPIVFLYKSPILIVLELAILHVTRFIEAPDPFTPRWISQ